MEIFRQILKTGKYVFLIIGFNLKLYPQQISLVYPKSGQVISRNNLNLVWNEDLTSNSYDVTISTNRNFSSFQVYFTSTNNYLLNSNSYNSWVYWKVKSTNLNYSTVDSFFVFRPTSFPNCMVWFDPDSLIKETNLIDVDTLFDLSGNLNHAFQTISIQKPQSFSEQFFQKKMVLFSGQQALLFPLIASPNYHFFSLCSPGSNKNIFETIISSAFAPNARWAIGVGFSSSEGSGWGGANGSIGLGNTNHINPNNYSLLNYSKNTSNWNITANSGFIRSIIDGSSPGYTGTHLWNLGSESGYNPLTGSIGAVIVYNRELSTNESTIVEKYFYDKYCPPVNLGANINHLNSFCADSLDAGPIYLSYLWSTGETTRIIHVNSSGKFWVRVTDYFGRISSDTIVIQKSTPIVNLLNQSILCNGTNLIWDTHLSKDKFTFEWQDNSTDSLITIYSSANVSVTVTDKFSCSVSYSINISSDNFASSASLGQNLSLCNGNKIHLISGLQNGLNYSWSTGATTPSITITNSGQYSVIVTNTNNCVAKDTINITIVGQAPTPNFSTTVGCKNNAVLFTDMSSFPVGNFITNTLWNFGDTPSSSNTSTLSNPYHTFSDTGNYNVSLTITLNTGCQQTITKPVHIAPKPLVSFIDGIACKNDSTLFTQTINTYGYPTISYAWDFGDPLSGINNTSLLPNPKYLFSQATNYTVKLIATNSAGCKDSISNTITVKAQVSANFTNSPLCTNIPVTFQDNSIVPTPNFQHIRLWNFGTGNVSGLSVSKIFTTPGVYSVSLTVNGFNGCISKTSKQFTITTPPISNFSVTNSCLNTPISITELSSFNTNYPISNWSWKINNAPFSNTQLPTLANQNVGSYAIKLITTNTAGCKDSIAKNSTVFPLPTVDFTSSPNINTYINQPITLTPNNLTAIDYNWTINTTNYSTPTLSFTPTSIGQYTINLTLKDTNGCVGNKTKQITITDYYLDLGILNINSTLNSNGFMEIDADIANFGTIPIYSFDINAQISNAATISETYTTTLNPNNLIRYRFNSKILANNSDLNNRICINVSSTSPIINDKNVNNNNLCIALSTTKHLINEPYPNPFNQIITLPIVLNQDTEISYEIINTLGETIISTTKQNGIEGLNLLSINTDSFSKGCYLLKITIDEKTYLKKIVKANNN